MPAFKALQTQNTYPSSVWFMQRNRNLSQHCRAVQWAHSSALPVPRNVSPKQFASQQQIMNPLPSMPSGLQAAMKTTFGDVEQFTIPLSSLISLLNILWEHWMIWSWQFLLNFKWSDEIIMLKIVVFWCVMSCNLVEFLRNLPLLGASGKEWTVI